MCSAGGPTTRQFPLVRAHVASALESTPAGGSRAARERHTGGERIETGRQGRGGGAGEGRRGRKEGGRGGQFEGEKASTSQSGGAGEVDGGGAERGEFSGELVGALWGAERSLPAGSTRSVTSGRRRVRVRDGRACVVKQVDGHVCCAWLCMPMHVYACCASTWVFLFVSDRFPAGVLAFAMSLFPVLSFFLPLQRTFLPRARRTLALASGTAGTALLFLRLRAGTKNRTCVGNERRWEGEGRQGGKRVRIGVVRGRARARVAQQ